ncbi:MAG: serine/threonine-protein kinase [Actinomycetia bacterium]|nr:serine/threonine-protein kinase [Actinomycetes bacterium]
MARQQTPPVVPGYEIGELIATGSSATVWAAAAPDHRPGQALAIKLVPVGHGDDGEQLAFELSALAATRGRHEHLIELLDVVAVQEPVPAVAIVMERLRRGTLSGLVTTRGHLTPGEVVTVLTPVAMAVAELHDSAILHADLSASNIGFDPRGRPVVLDLGVSSVIGVRREEIYGTPGFVAPEIVAGEVPTASADVYSLGALGWYALTGEPPAIPAERPSLDELGLEIPEEMVQALERALHWDPLRRGDARDLATAVYASAQARPVDPPDESDPATMLTHRVRRRAAADDEDRGGEHAEPEGGRHAQLRDRSRPAMLRAVAALVAALVLGVAGVLTSALARSTDDVSADPGSAPTLPADWGLEDQGDQSGDPEQGDADQGDPVSTALLQSAVDARATAWNTGDIGALAAAFTPDGGELDTRLLSEAAASGHSYDGLTFTVDEAITVEESVDRLVLAAIVTTSSYVVHPAADAVAGPGAQPESRPAESAHVVFTLVKDGTAWLIDQVGPPAS